MKHHTSLLAGWAMLIALTIFSIPAAATRYYVKENGTTTTGTGSWGDAYGDLQLAINNASAGDSIFVAAGTYYPTRKADNLDISSPNNRDNAFVLKEDVKIYGGFKGNDDNETVVQRDWKTNQTTLSGDIGVPGNPTDNAYHVVISVLCTNATLLDGFTISGGNADGSSFITVNNRTVSEIYGGGMYNMNSSPTLTNVTISGNVVDNQGGGMYNIYFSSPTLTNVTISGNSASGHGGGMLNNSSSPRLTNVTISGNQSTTNGGGMYNYYSSSPTLTNVTISGNTANNGGGMYNSVSTPTIQNSIIWGNNSGVYNNSSVLEYTYSLVQDSFPSGTGNLDGTNAANDPQFVNPLSPDLSTGGDYRLKEGSPVINKGSNSLYAETGAGTKDLDGNFRIRGNPDSIDLGAYEFVEIFPTNGIIYVDSAVAATSNYTGSSWKNAIASLDEALAYTKAHNPGNDSIFVAKGTYYPSVIAGDGKTDRDKAFVLVKDVKIYGGFAGTEDTIDQRTPGNTTILSGNNTYHVVISADSVGAALLDGLTISGGNATGSDSIIVNTKKVSRNAGGGLSNVSSSPKLVNVTISRNAATNGGGISNDTSLPALTNVTISGNVANYGAGIYNNASSPLLTNAIVNNNVASNGGGGMYNATSLPVLTNVTIGGNTATDGGGIYNNFSAPTIRNSIIWGNGNSNVFGDASTYKYSLVQGEHLTGDGNLDSTLNPQFVDAAGGDYHLHWSSSAINAGSKIFNATTNDLDGRPRFDSDSIDLGAYEFVETIFPNDSGILYVDSSKSTGTHTGYNWSNAVVSLDQALFYPKRQHYVHPAATYSIFVAKGTYYPSIIAGTGSNMRDQAFVLVKDVKIYGGFAGTEAIIDQRTPGNTTILSGNNNAYHVVISADSVGAALLDGLTISGGNANGSDSIIVNTKKVSRNAGGGMYNHTSSPTLTNIVINGNEATNGGGMYNDSSSPTLTNVTISGNTATDDGGGMYNVSSSSPKLTNVTISGNMADMFGGGMYNYYYSTLSIKNSIIWGNNSGVSNDNAAPVYTYSLVQDSFPSGTGNLDGTDVANNPRFVNPLSPGLSTGGDYRLQEGSPVINKGSNSLYAETGAGTKDLDGNLRIRGNPDSIDLGAYEFVEIVPTNGIIYVDSAVAATSNYTGSSWENAIAGLDEALAYTKTHNPGKDSIFVAKGTYYPSVKAAATENGGNPTTDRDKAFVLVEDVKIYGGFAGNETNIDQRDWKTNKTILSGDLGTKDNIEDNAYHVVISADAVGTALLDGLTISGGNANGRDHIIIVNSQSISRDFGGGMYNYSSSPTLTNVTISGNTANYSGGMYNYSSSPTLTNVTISGNQATTNGGGMYTTTSSSPKLTNVTICGNSANYYGGGMYNVSSPKLTNVTISGNSAVNGGGGMYNVSSSKPTIKNSIIWGNNYGVYCSGVDPEYSYSLVQDINPPGTSNLDGTDAANNPQFVNQLPPGLSTGGDYRLKWRSPAIDAGNNADNATTKDLAGNPRRLGTIDMGAYEYTLFPTNGIVYVDSAVVGGKHDGSSWANAVDTLDEALFFTKWKTSTGGAADSIFVAKGTYYPSVIAGQNPCVDPTTAPGDKAFVLVKDVKIYGGFAGNDTTIDQRTPGNTTILSGNNTYHVVISADSVGAALLDGLTIGGGNANGSDSIIVNTKTVSRNAGGGMYNHTSSPTLINIAISGNKGAHGAGIYNDSSSSPLLTNAIIINNTASNGGGMYNNNASSPVLTNVTIGGNSATIGGGIYNSSSTPTIQNSIIWGNNSGVFNNSAVPEYKYSLVQGEHLTDNGNLDSTINPQFVDSAGGDYRLKWSSPAIDVGNNAFNTTTTDLAGNPRFSHNLIDLGAYENQDNYYIVVLPDGEITGISSINITADENDYLQFLPGKYRVLSGNNFTFTLIYADDYDDPPAIVKNNNVVLLPNDAGTYTVSADAVVTINGVGNSDTEDEDDEGDGDGDGGNGGGGGNYDGIGLVITDGTTTIIEHIYINGIEVPFDTTAAVNYTVVCGQSEKLIFSLIIEASGPGLLEFPPNRVFNVTPKPGLNHIPVNIFAINGRLSHEYDFVVEKLFEYDSLIAQKWNNTLLVRINPNNNGGYTFVQYEWFRNNTSIGTEGFYSAGNKRTDLLDFDALYHAEVRTDDGRKLQTCPGKPVRTAVAASLRVYPNPVRSGNIAHIRSGVNIEQLLNVAEPTEVSIYNSMGKFVKVQKLTAPLTEFVLDVTPGLYFIRLGEQQVKVFVD